MLFYKHTAFGSCTQLVLCYCAKGGIKGGLKHTVIHLNLNPIFLMNLMNKMSEPGSGRQAFKVAAFKSADWNPLLPGFQYL